MFHTFTATLAEKKNLAGEVWWFRFALPAGEVLEFEPGQYVILVIGENFRQYSICSPQSDREHLELIVEYVPNGVASVYLSALEIGGQATFKGPAGVFTLKKTPTDKIFLATGTGIAPIMSMIHTHLTENRPGNLHLYFGLKTRADVYLIEELAQFAQAHANFNYTICLSREESLDGLDPKHMRLGRVNVSCDAFLADKNPNDFEYYICGSKDMVESIKNYVLEKSVPAPQVFAEKFTL